MPSCMPPPYSATEQPRVEQPKSNIRKIPGNKFFAITTLIGGSLLAILGVVAIIVEAQMAYIGAPIWTGIIVSILEISYRVAGCSRQSEMQEVYYSESQLLV